MSVAWRKRGIGAAFGAVLGLWGSVVAAQGGDIVVVDDAYAYHKDNTSYDSDKDVVVTKGEDIEFGAFWVAIQCSSDTVWMMNKLTGVWKDPQALGEDMNTFRDVLCSLRGSLPYLAF